MPHREGAPAPAARSPGRVSLNRSTSRFSNANPVTGVHLYVHHSSPDTREEATMNDDAGTTETDEQHDEETHIVRGLD